MLSTRLGTTRCLAEYFWDRSAGAVEQVERRNGTVATGRRRHLEQGVQHDRFDSRTRRLGEVWCDEPHTRHAPMVSAAIPVIGHRARPVEHPQLAISSAADASASPGWLTVDSTG